MFGLPVLWSGLNLSGFPGVFLDCHKPPRTKNPDSYILYMALHAAQEILEAIGSCVRGMRLLESAIWWRLSGSGSGLRAQDSLQILNAASCNPQPSLHLETHRCSDFRWRAVMSDPSLYTYSTNKQADLRPKERFCRKPCRTGYPFQPPKFDSSARFVGFPVTWDEVGCC